MRNPWLLAGGILSALAAVLHLAIIAGGPSWYLFFGAGRRMAWLAAHHSPRPALIAIAIAAMLALWSAYALSGAGVIRRLPLLRLGLVTITAIYLLRAAALPFMLGHMPGRTPAFLVWSSVVVLVYGIVHTVGLLHGWRQLGREG
jgi:hypothetical protein